MNANPILLQKKYSRVIECFADKMNISLNAALDFFYRSEVYCLMRDGVSDMHCIVRQKPRFAKPARVSVSERAFSAGPL